MDYHERLSTTCLDGEIEFHGLLCSATWVYASSPYRAGLCMDEVDKKVEFGTQV